MESAWTPERILEMARGFQPACVLIAGAELDVFTALEGGPLDGDEVARRLDGETRAVGVVLDALAALGLLAKEGERYRLGPGVAETLVEGAPSSVLAMVRHQGNCLRRWAELAAVADSGAPPEIPPSVRGPEEDLASFIGAMDEINRSVADAIVARLQPQRFRHILDVGGASGTWTIAFLKAAAQARGTLFDRPDVIPLAERRLGAAGLLDRVRLAPGDFDLDPLPGGADLVWLSAIVHQNSREENRALFGKAREALLEGGEVAIRDILMEPCRTKPPMGALFAVNMLVGTEGGGTFTFDELAEDLRAAGLRDPKLLHRGEAMDSIVTAKKA